MVHFIDGLKRESNAIKIYRVFPILRRIVIILLLLIIPRENYRGSVNGAAAGRTHTCNHAPTRLAQITKLLVLSAYVRF